jgi:outer membrane protein insertion porin family
MIALWVVLFVLLGSGSSQAVVGLTEATGRPVTRLDVDNPSRVSDSEIEQLLLLRPGDAYDWGKVQRSLQLLAQKVEIRNVILRGEIEGEGIALHLDVVPEPLVRKLRFEGNRSLKRSQLASELQTRVDRPARDPLLIRDAAALEELYRSEGFPMARVTPRVDILPDRHWLHVVFDIVEGQPLPIVRVEVSGDPPLEREQLLARLGLRVGDPASALRLRHGVRRVVEALRREGYLEADAEGPRFRTEAQGAVLELPLKAGERVALILDGIDEWAGRPLRAIARSRFGETIDEKWARRGGHPRVRARVRAPHAHFPRQ